MTVNDLDEETFQSWYGRWRALDPPEVAALLDGSGVRWWIAGGRAARVGAASRHHEDTDVVLYRADLPALRRHLARWHLWQAHQGALRPLLSGDEVPEACDQLWLRRDARHPWIVDLLLHRDADEWIFKRDDRVRLPWTEALHSVDGIAYLRPEIALLYKAHTDRVKNRADLAAAALDPAARAWLIDTLELLGHHDWARAARRPAC